MSRGEELYDVLRLTRPLVLTSARVVEATWRQHGITVAGRAVLEALESHGPLTVPHLSRLLDIARQGVQRTVTELERSGLVAATPNPAHRRSPLLTLTAEARRLFAALHAGELEVLDAMAEALTDEEIAAARRVLETLADGVRRRAQQLTAPAGAGAEGGAGS